MRALQRVRSSLVAGAEEAVQREAGDEVVAVDHRREAALEPLSLHHTHIPHIFHSDMRRIFVSRRNLSEAATQEHHRARLAGAIQVPV